MEKIIGARRVCAGATRVLLEMESNLAKNAGAHYILEMSSFRREGTKRKRYLEHRIGVTSEHSNYNQVSAGKITTTWISALIMGIHSKRRVK